MLLHTKPSLEANQIISELAKKLEEKLSQSPDKNLLITGQLRNIVEGIVGFPISGDLTVEKALEYIQNRKLMESAFHEGYGLKERQKEGRWILAHARCFHRRGKGTRREAETLLARVAEYSDEPIPRKKGVTLQLAAGVEQLTRSFDEVSL